jgi:hypothetical protein
MEMIDGINKQEERSELEGKRVGEENRDKIGSSFKAQLEFAPAGQIPSPPDPDRIEGSIEDHKINQDGGQKKSKDGRMEDHGGATLPSLRRITLSAIGDS